MDAQRLSPVVVTVLAALAILYPMASTTRAPGKTSASLSEIASSAAHAEVSEPADEGFPTAKDIVSGFLFSRREAPEAPSPQAAPPPYSVDLVIATVPDPVSSRLPYFFDSIVESIERAAEASGYTLDRFALPWSLEGQGQRDRSARLHEGSTMKRRPPRLRRAPERAREMTLTGLARLPRLVRVLLVRL